MKRNYNVDPAWSRSNKNNAKKKKRKMVSRASLRLLSTLIRKKRSADRGKEKTICVTRTVELPSIQTIGEEKSKLLFMLAIGLVPNTDHGHPFVKVERLDPAVEDKARARTKEVLHEIFERQLEAVERSAARHSKLKLVSNSLILSTSTLNDEPPQDDDNVELVDLVSEDEVPCTNVSDSDSDIEISADCGAYRQSSQRPQSRGDNSSYNRSQQSFRIITSRKPVFKPIANNQDNKIFRNWKPESMSHYMNSKQSGAEKDARISQLKGSQLKLLSSLNSIPTTSTRTVRKFPSNLSAGGNCKSHVHGAREDSSSSSCSSELDFMVSDPIITID